jgi:hypothetical protein
MTSAVPNEGMRNVSQVRRPIPTESVRCCSAPFRQPAE